MKFRKHDDDKKKRAPRRRWFTVVIWVAIGVISISVVFYGATYYYLTIPNTHDESIITQDPCAPPCWYDLSAGQSTHEDVTRVLSNSDFIPDWAINRDERIISWHWAPNHRGVFRFNDDGILHFMQYCT